MYIHVIHTVPGVSVTSSRCQSLNMIRGIPPVVSMSREKRAIVLSDTYSSVNMTYSKTRSTRESL